MTRVANPKDAIANGAVAYIVNELQAATTDFHEELDKNTKFSSAHITSRDGSAKTHADNAIRMLRWLYETEFGLVPPTPLTNAEVDTINADIRTFEDRT